MAVNDQVEPAEASSLDPMAGSSDDRHPLILLLSAVFWVFREYALLMGSIYMLKPIRCMQYGYFHGLSL